MKSSQLLEIIPEWLFDEFKQWDRMQAVQHATHDLKSNKDLVVLYSNILILKVQPKHTCTSAWAYNEKVPNSKNLSLPSFSENNKAPVKCFHDEPWPTEL